MDLEERLERAWQDLEELHLAFTISPLPHKPTDEDRSRLGELQELVAEYQRIFKQIEVLWKIAEDDGE